MVPPVQVGLEGDQVRDRFLTMGLRRNPIGRIFFIRTPLAKYSI